MRFGIALFPLRASQMVEAAVAADELGYDSVWIGDHVISPNDFESRYPYHDDADDKPAFHSRLPFYDPFAALSYIGAATDNVRLVLSVSIVPLHDPYHLARSVMTIDQFTNGRFDFGVGVGWLKEEFDIVGAQWARRGARMEEMLDLMQRLWTEESVEFHGEFYELPPAGMEPKPLTQPHPPFVFGGVSPIALERTARLGEGWYGVGLDFAGIERCVDQLRELRKAAGRSDPIEISVAPEVPLSAEVIARYEEVGVDRLVIRPWDRGRDAVDRITATAEQLGLSASR